ncbi:MAG: hypothetical protein R6U52_11305 [Kosmotogaceae bacterium]
MTGKWRLTAVIVISVLLLSVSQFPVQSANSNQTPEQLKQDILLDIIDYTKNPSDSLKQQILQKIIDYMNAISLTTPTPSPTPDNDTNIINESLYNSSELEEQADGKLGILDSFIDGLIDNRVTKSFVNSLFAVDLTVDKTWNVSEDYLYNSSGLLTLNETRLNSTIDERDDFEADTTIPDTNETERFDHLTSSNCPGTDKMIGVDNDGNIICGTDIDNNTEKSGGGFYLFNDTDKIYLNETRLNSTIDERASGTTYTAGSNLTLDGTEFNWDSSWSLATFVKQSYEGQLDVNSSDYWDGLNTPGDILFSDLSPSNIDVSGHNITASNINGKFNWTTTDDWNNFDGYTLDFNETKMSATYHGGNSLNIVAGNLEGGTLNDTIHPDGKFDGVSLHISEVNSDPGLDVRVNLTGIEEFSRGIARYNTTELSGERPVFQIYNFERGNWEGYKQAVETQTCRVSEISVFNDDGYINPEGTVMMRLYKSEKGKVNNEYYFDWLALSSGFGVPAGDETDPRSIHRSGSVPLTGHWDAGNYSINASGFKDTTDNIVQVESEDDLPSPSGGKIQLKNNTVYYFKGFVTSNNTLVLGNPSPIVGSHGATDGFIHTGGQTAIEGQGSPFFLRNMYVHSPGGTLLNISADNSTEFLVQSSAFSDAAGFGNIADLGTIDGFRVPTIKSSSIEEFDSGFTFTGTCNKVFIADSPFRSVNSGNVTVITFDDNFDTKIVDMVDNYFKAMQQDTKIVNERSGAEISDIFQYRGNTHGNTVNKSNILVGSAGVEEVNYRVRDSYPLRDSSISGIVVSNITDPQTITGSGTSWQTVDIPSQIYNAERTRQVDNSTLQYIGKRDVGAELTARVVVTGVGSDDIRTRLVKNNESLTGINGFGSTFNSNSFTTIAVTESKYLERYDNTSIQIQNFGGTSDVDVRELSISITK